MGRPMAPSIQPCNARFAWWLAADGSHNRMIRTPNGQLLCGRAEAWTPLNPLFEPVITCRPCGDGRPTFETLSPVLLR